MTLEGLFSSLNLLALVAWIPLVLFPRARWASSVVPVLVPVALGVVYTTLLAASLPASEGGFSSLEGVRTLFQDSRALLAGWTHYLAFDLFVGGWEIRDARRRGVPHLLVVPALALTFFAGPAGLLLYAVVRTFAGRGEVAKERP